MINFMICIDISRNRLHQVEGNQFYGGAPFAIVDAYIKVVNYELIICT